MSITKSKSPMPGLIAFYAGTGCDHAGRKLNEILSWDDADLEYTHDYIQWLFPNRKASAFNANAPLLTDDDVTHFKQIPFLTNEVLRAYERMRQFYKIDIGPPYWWDDLRYAHNWLRMTRIILCLQELGLNSQAEYFHKAISKASLPDKRTRAFWASTRGQ